MIAVLSCAEEFLNLYSSLHPLMTTSRGIESDELNSHDARTLVGVRGVTLKFVGTAKNTNKWKKLFKKCYFSHKNAVRAESREPWTVKAQNLLAQEVK